MQFICDQNLLLDNSADILLILVYVCNSLWNSLALR